MVRRMSFSTSNHLGIVLCFFWCLRKSEYVNHYGCCRHAAIRILSIYDHIIMLYIMSKVIIIIKNNYLYFIITIFPPGWDQE